MKKLVLTMFVLLGFISINAAENPSQFSKFSWLGLWNTQMLTWAESIERFSQLCPNSLSNAEVTKCRKKYSTVKVWAIPTHADATFKSDKVGEIRIAVTPQKAFEYSFWSSLTQDSNSFTPDMFDPDWGYGPTSHQTVIDRKGDWVKLPKKPFPKDVWIKLDSKLVQKELLSIQIDDVYRLGEQNLIILKVENTKLLVRIEQDADYWCDPGTPPPLKKLKPFWIGKKELWNNDHHLKLKRAHSRGC